MKYFIVAIFPAVGAGLLIVGLAKLWGIWRLTRKGVRTTGTVVGYRIEEDTNPENPADLHHAIVEFDDAHHVRQRAEILVGRMAHFAKGEKVAVLFDPVQPSRAHIPTFFFMWLYPLALAAMGVIFLTAGLVLGVLLDAWKLLGVRGAE